MKVIAKYLIFAVMGAAIPFDPFNSWQFWAWLLPLIFAVHVHDWAMMPNVKWPSYLTQNIASNRMGNIFFHN